MTDQNGKQSLTAELHTTRANLTSYVAALRRDLDPGLWLKASFADRPAAWFGGAATLGLFLSGIPRMRRKVVIQVPSRRRPKTEAAAPFIFAALKFGLDLAKPALVRWFKDETRDRPNSRSATAK
jgi:hypothetical protein